jgi:hypothetical protein
MMRFQKYLVVGFVLCFAFSLQAASKEWLHVRVQNLTEAAETVKINIPLSLVETMLPLIEEKSLQDGRIHLNNKDVSTAELRKIWKAVKDEGDTEFVTVEKKGENVRIFTESNFLMVQSDKDSAKKVNIKIPLAVVDAMLAGSGEGLNLMAAVQALRESGVRDIISVQDEKNTVQVWIDNKSKAK